MKTVAYIMAKNEEDKIVSCVKHLMWCDEVIVADTGSLDKTAEAAEKAGARVIRLPFEGFGKTRNNIIKNIDADWIVCFDADEMCTPALAMEIQTAIGEEKFVAFKAPRQNFLFGKKIKHSGWYPDYRHPICFKKSCSHYDDRDVHENLVVNGRIGYLKEPFGHFSHDNLIDYVEKSKKYAAIGANQLLKSQKSISMPQACFHGISRFLRHYFFKLGFLDGWAGLLIATTSAYGTFIRYATACEKKSKQKKSSENKIPESYL